MKQGLRNSFLFMTVVPILALGLIVLAVAFTRVQSTVYDEVHSGMQDIAYAVANTYETIYPGDYSVVESETLKGLKKGDTLLTADYLNCIQADTGLELTLFYGDVRFLTTLKDSSGKEVVGLAMNSVIRKRVLEADAKQFFSDTHVNNTTYFAYYMPLHASGGSVIGAIEVLKRADEVKSSVWRSVAPIIIIAIVVMLIAGACSIAYARSIRSAIDKLLQFLLAVEKGNLKKEVDPTLTVRKDEIGQMARAASSMQFALRDLVERDALTKLYNRRHANLYLKEAWRATEVSGTKYCICIGDIDFFKKVNDTYGHDAGDLVLQTVAGILKRNMAGKGMVARWGGEEFIFAFEDQSLEAASDLLWSILRQIRAEEIAYGEQLIKITMSFGVTDAAGLTIEEALKIADDRLYYSKEHGRNQVVDH